MASLTAKGSEAAATAAAEPNKNIRRDNSGMGAPDITIRYAETSLYGDGGPILTRASMSAEPDLTIRYAESDADVVAIHRFLCVVAGPTLPGPIDPKDSATEVWRVVYEDVAVMALDGDKLVGTIGLIRPLSWWNNKVPFLANRWYFALPGMGAGRALLKEAIGIAVASDLELHIFDETKQRLKIFNKSKNRNR